MTTLKTAETGSVKRRALSLGAANIFDYAMQFLLPVILVRALPAEAFGEYRLLWLAVLTAVSLAPLDMHHVLYFFLPRSDTPTKRLHVHQTLLYLCFGGMVAGLALSPLNPWLPAEMQALARFGTLVPALAVLFAATLLIDVLPTVEERTSWQAGFTIGFSLLRTAALSAVAILTGDVVLLVWTMTALMLFKFLMLLFYVSRVHGLRGRWLDREVFLRQFRHAWPLGISSSVFGLRRQADQWIAASSFALTNFASFSIAAVFSTMVNMARQSVTNVVVPSMSRLHAAGDMDGMIRLNRRANVIIATLAYPLLAFAFGFAEDLITLVYTGTYAAAAPVLRVYAFGMAVMVVELGSIMLLTRDGAFSLRLSLVLLAVSVAVSWLAAQRFGLPGAAAGSTLALFADRIVTLRRIATSTGLPLRQLQDWPALARLLLFSIVAGAAAWAVAEINLRHVGIIPRLLAAATVMASLYAAMLALADGFRPATVQVPANTL